MVEKKIKEAKACATAVRSSTRKLNVVAASIRGLKVENALTQLSFSPRRVAGEVKKVLQSAIANAENNHNMDVDRLIVSEAYVGKAMVMKRWQARARGRAGRIKKMFSNVTIVVREHEEKR
jgi:large subunit ribosomal protein L22